MLRILLGIWAFVLLFTNIIAALRLEEHRTDVRPGEKGASPIWQVNVYNPANYTSKGRTLLGWFCLLNVAWLVTLLAIASAFYQQ